MISPIFRPAQCTLDERAEPYEFTGAIVWIGP